MGSVGRVNGYKTGNLLRQQSWKGDPDNPFSEPHLSPQTRPICSLKPCQYLKKTPLDLNVSLFTTAASVSFMHSLSVCVRLRERARVGEGKELCWGGKTGHMESISYPDVEEPANSCWPLKTGIHLVPSLWHLLSVNRILPLQHFLKVFTKRNSLAERRYRIPPSSFLGGGIVPF